jgi:hypothetical protein
MAAHARNHHGFCQSRDVNGRGGQFRCPVSLGFRASGANYRQVGTYAHRPSDRGGYWQTKADFEPDIIQYPHRPATLGPESLDILFGLTHAVSAQNRTALWAIPVIV